MRSSEIRDKFLKYFEKQGHKVLPGSSLIPKDPTVLLTLAGMLQFKPIFMGIEPAEYKRVATAQKCVRTNDIENVGHTQRHHTFFEMLGNFSFGDYFKKEAIKFSWELLTKEFNIDRTRLNIAIYEKDDESGDIWEKDIGIPSDKIFRLGEDNNFWAAGPTGPCGPCSEIYYDLGEKTGCGKKECGPGCDCDRFLEIWNLVFMEFNRNEKGELSPLPEKNIDTGMGFERITSVLQGVPSNFETDIFIPIVEGIMEMLGDKSRANETSLRIISDHARAAVHLISDGLVPQNEGRNYILRRIIRRAMLHGKRIGLDRPFLSKLAGKVIDSAKDFYPDLSKNSPAITKTLLVEEESFIKTLETGSGMLQEIIASSKGKIEGKDAFKLYDTYGFPVELTREIAAEKGLGIDEDSFAKEMQKQKVRSREGSSKQYSIGAIPQVKGLPPTEFVGYASLDTEAKVLAVIDGFIILDKTPFYAESGGQDSDRGHLVIEKNRFLVTKLYKTAEDVVLHAVDGEIMPSVGEKIRAEVDANNRAMTAAHHTSTHLLHAALRKILGPHAQQKGSFVAGDRFRFDFTSNERVGEEQLKKIEEFVNDLIKQKIPVETIVTTIEQAISLGATALFGEKYKNEVRVIKIGDISMELCGGTHVKNTKEIQLFKIIKEGAIAQGIRRIEAVSGKPAEFFIKEQEEKRKKQLEAEKKKLEEKEDLKMQENKIRQEKIEEYKLGDISIKYFDHEGYDPKVIASYAKELVKNASKTAVALVSGTLTETTLTAASSSDLVALGSDSSSVWKKYSEEIGGKGGGKKDFAQGWVSLKLNDSQKSEFKSLLTKQLENIEGK